MVPFLRAELLRWIPCMSPHAYSCTIFNDFPHVVLVPPGVQHTSLRCLILSADRRPFDHTYPPAHSLLMPPAACLIAFGHSIAFLIQAPSAANDAASIFVLEKMDPHPCPGKTWKMTSYGVIPPCLATKITPLDRKNHLLRKNHLISSRASHRIYCNHVALTALLTSPCHQQVSRTYRTKSLPKVTLATPLSSQGNTPTIPQC